MSIIRVPYPNSLPTEQDDYVKQNNLIETGFLMVNKPKWTDGTNILKGNVFQIGGTVYHATSDTAITGTPSDYIKLTPSGDGSTAAAAFVANLTGVTWNDTYNGYYDVSGNLYVFDEIKAFYSGEVTSLNMKLWNAIMNSIQLRKGLLDLVLTEYTTTAEPEIGAGSYVEINGSMYSNTADVSISGSTSNSTWYDILLTPSGSSFTASFVARNTGVWSDSKQGLYSGNNRVVGCVYKDGSGNFINKNVLVVNNRNVSIKIEIGLWNMDSSASHDVPHGLGSSIDKIRNINAIMFNDLGATFSISFYRNLADPGLLAAGFYVIDSTNITLNRRAGGETDNTSFNDSINRGFVYMTYEV